MAPTLDVLVLFRKVSQMRFPGIRLVEQTEQKFRRIRDCPKKNKKTSDCNIWAFIPKAPTKNALSMTISFDFVNSSTEFQDLN